MADLKASGASFLGMAVILFGVGYFADLKWVVVVATLQIVATLRTLRR